MSIIQLQLINSWILVVHSSELSLTVSAASTDKQATWLVQLYVTVAKLKYWQQKTIIIFKCIYQLWSLQTPPVKSDVGCMSKGRNWGINEVPCAAFPWFTLLTDTHSTVRDLLDKLSQFLGGSRLATYELSGTSFKGCRMADYHHVSAVLTDALHQESDDIEWALVELLVCLVGLEIFHHDLGCVIHVNVHPKLGQLFVGHEGRHFSPGPS